MEQNQGADESASCMSKLILEARNPQTTPERLVELSKHVELRPLVAANARTSSAHLEELSKDANKQVRQAVAGNANASLDCLLHLAREFPEMFFLNPLCMFLELADPGWRSRIDDVTWLYLLKSEQIPRTWLDWLEKEKGCEDAARNRSLKQPADPYEVRVAARLHTDQPELHAHGKHIGHELARGIEIVALHERTPAPLLMELATVMCQYGSFAEIGGGVCEQVRRNVAQNKAAPANVLQLLAADPDTIVRQRVGRNKQTPRDVLERLSLDVSAYVRSGVAANEMTPVEILERLAFDNTYEEKYEQAKRQIAPHAKLHEASRMYAQEALNNLKLVKGSLARNEATPAHILLYLATHPELEIRERLAGNPAAPEKALMCLVGDAERVLEKLVEHPRLPIEVLSKLAVHPFALVRSGVASHLRTPPAVLARLAADSHIRVREAVAKNPHTPVATLEKLAAEGDDTASTETIVAVRAALAQNPATPGVVLIRLANSSTRTIILALGKNPNLSTNLIDHLLEIAQKKDVFQDLLVRHPGLSVEHLERLAQHTNADVRRAAQRRLERLSQLGERGLQRYPYLDSAGHSLRETVPLATPLYEIQARALEAVQHYASGPEGFRLRDVLKRFPLSAALRQEIFELLLPTWSQKWKEHTEQSSIWLELLAEFDLSAAWQRAFAASPLWKERYAMAVRPDIKTDLLERLADDGNRYVRAAARWYLQEQQNRT